MRFMAIMQNGGGHFKFSSDTFANAFTYRAAQLACGSVIAVTQAVVSGASDRGVALVRPPGHHAEPDAAMGFCLYNNVRV
jgi:acetoin utilization deacetylase AcuC-like enzyme